MTNEEKDLLLKDLCARLPYGVKCGVLTHPKYRSPNWKKEDDLYYKGRPEYKTLDSAILNINPIECFYPYLRPMSSMTEEELNEYSKLTDFYNLNVILGHEAFQIVSWLNAHHFDYNFLILKGLALEAPEGMYEIVPTSI